MVNQSHLSLAAILAAALGNGAIAISPAQAEAEAPPIPDYTTSDPSYAVASPSDSVAQPAVAESLPQVEYAPAYDSRYETGDRAADLALEPAAPVEYAQDYAQPAAAPPAPMPADVVPVAAPANAIAEVTSAQSVFDAPVAATVAPVAPAEAQAIAPAAANPAPVAEAMAAPATTSAVASPDTPIESPVVERLVSLPEVIAYNPTVTAANQTQIRIEQTTPPYGNFPGQPVRPNGVQRQLGQLQQQQQQLQQQIEQLQKQLAQKEQTAVALQNTNPQGLTVSGEALFWRPSTSDTLDYAISDPGTALATSGDLQTVELDRATGGRVGLNYRFAKSPWDVGGKYTFFNTEGQSSATAPAGGLLFSTLSHPFQNETAATADATAKLGYKTGDLEAGYNLKAGNVDVRLFGGLRASDVSRDLTVAYDGVDYTNGQVQLENRFKGIGPRVGTEAKVPLGAGFNVFGKGALSLQAGTLNSSFRETDRAGADVIADISRNQGGRLVPGVELAAGVGWEKKMGNTTVNIGGGYELQHLFNATDNIRFSDAASPGSFSQNNGDIGTRGLFLKAGVKVDF
jgi:cell division protein FtsB